MSESYKIISDTLTTREGSASLFQRERLPLGLHLYSQSFQGHGLLLNSFDPIG